MKRHWRTILLGLVTLVVLGVLNAMVWHKEQLLADGQTVYLKLAPVDPRSLMQGDYMRLSYAIADPVEKQRGAREAQGKLVARLDDRRVGHFERLYEGGTVDREAGEVLLTWKYRERIVVGANAFYFQEGTAEKYEDCEYAKLKVADHGGTVLVGLVEEPE